MGDEGCIAANPTGTFGLECARDAYRMWQGGNQWAGWCSYLNFFREVAQLPIDWSRWMPWERLAEHGGPRIVHPDFCIISDFPVVLTKDAENRPHNDTGPFCRWSDGVALYAVHGTRVPAWLIECPERLTREAIDAEANDEVRRVMIDRYGVGRYTSESGREIERCQDWDQGLDVVMYERPGIPGEADRVVRVLRMENSTPDPDGTRRTYWRRVPPSMGCREAYLWTCGLPAGAQFVVRT